MTPPKYSSTCPLCSKICVAMQYHLRKSHFVENIEERRVLLGLATGRLNIRSEACPVAGCQYKSTRLDKHLTAGHPELDDDGINISLKMVRRQVALAKLAALRASNPAIPLASGLDLVLLEEEEQQVREQDQEEEQQVREQDQEEEQQVREQDQGEEEPVPEECTKAECIALQETSRRQANRLRALEIQLSQHLKRNKRDCKTIRRLTAGLIKDSGEAFITAERQGMEGDDQEAGTSSQPAPAAEDLSDEELSFEEPAAEEPAAEKAQVDKDQNIKRLFRGSGRSSGMRSLVFSKSIDEYLEEYKRFHQGSAPTAKQKENALSMVSRVKSFIFFMAWGNKELCSWKFLHNPEGIRNYATHLQSSGKTVTTATFYLRNIYQFCKYISETPPSLSQLSQVELVGIIRAVKSTLTNLSKPVVLHQLKVKSKKMDKLVSRSSLKKCQEKAKAKIPELLDQMEASGESDPRCTFYGYFSAFVASVYGHHPGVLTNMMVEEVWAAKEEDQTTPQDGYLITVNEHKTNRNFGAAQIYLEPEEYVWLERWLGQRALLKPANDRVFVTSGKGPVKKSAALHADGMGGDRAARH
ncbi:uncharacterized protein LOC142939013 isoform X2 [Anarhichas minor]|uniref:uncharacterized protein LOC142939013 isoform X2 n=1 Tax=Anarhichas minor TaxID=65739 RepID=UPI003F736212